MPTATENGAVAAPVAAAAVVMAQPRIIKPIPIVLDRARTLVMDFAAMEAFETATNLSAWSREAWDGNPRHLAALIWAALLHEDPDLTLDQVKRMPSMTLANLGYLQDRLTLLWGETMPEADESEAAASEGDRDSDPNPRRRAG